MEKPLDFHGSGAFNYYIPSPNECNRCHTKESGGLIGVNTAQLNRDSQLTSWQEKEMFNQSIGNTGLLTAMARYEDQMLDNTVRARSYLHAQCAHCHRPGVALQQSQIDFRYLTPPAQMNICETDPQHGKLGPSDSKLLKAGDAIRSIVFLRSISADKSVRMPPLATSLNSVLGIELLKTWIEEMQSCH